MKRGSGLSMNVIIISALALLVLVILAVSFVSKMGNTVSTIERCNGECMTPENCGKGTKLGGTECSLGENKESGMICCVYIKP